MFNFNINIVTPYKSTVRKPLFKLYYSMRSYFCFNRILAGVIALLLMATIFYACAKTTNDVAPSNGNDNQSLGAAASEAMVSGLYNDLFTVAMEVTAEQGYTEAGRTTAANKPSGKLGGCYIFEVDDYTKDRWPKVVTYTFAPGCADAAGRSRSGVLKLTYSGYLHYPGTTITIEPVGYTVNGVSITGTKVISNLSTNEVYKYNARVTGATIKLDTITMTYGSNFTFTQTAGLNSLANVYDDVYSVVGSDTVSFNGNVAITTISDSSALIRKLDCPYIGQGKATLTLKSVSATIDYGNGVCDDSALVTIKDKVKTVKLPK